VLDSVKNPVRVFELIRWDPSANCELFQTPLRDWIGFQARLEMKPEWVLRDLACCAITAKLRRILVSFNISAGAEGV
jgi:hypothetical protein